MFTSRSCCAAALAIVLGTLLPNAEAETISCRSESDTVKAVTIAEDYFPVTTRFQIDVPNLQPLLEPNIQVPGPGPNCVVV